MVVKIWNERFEPQWKFRNQCVHSINKTKRSTRESENLLTIIGQLRNQETSSSLLWKDRQLMEEPISQILKRPATQRNGWIHSFRIAQKSRDMSQASEEVSMTNAMQKNLTKSRPQAHTKNLRRKGFGKKKRRVGLKNKRKKLKPSFYNQHFPVIGKKPP